ncbi:quinone oxidoreductase family protein [Shinella daejeonensis]|uniref:quinone oxidoreductase family protein n=1 Tax=Shinella daejeonensis TaxID=659017 RepID=UPI0020C79D49|nr:zinc-binding alcohol dehydrogenase family protein [Shinella daejeonensis]
MKAIVLNRPGNPPEMVIEDRPRPVIKPGYSLVRMRAATINQLSNFLRTASFGNVPAPLVLGNEGAGVIEESRAFAAGAKVAIYGGKDLGIVEDGLFQEWVLVEDRRLFPLPETLTLDEGATLSVNYLTAYRALTKAVQVEAGQTVAISGATGSVGNALVQTAKALGARPIALVSSSEKARRAEAAGASDVIDLSAVKDVAAKVRDLTGGKGADFAFDPVGGPLINLLLRSLARRGTLVSIGFTAGMEATIDVADLLSHEKHIVGYSLHGETDEDIYPALRVLADLAGQGKLKPIIDTAVEFADFEAGYERLTSRKAVGSIVIHL